LPSRLDALRSGFLGGESGYEEAAVFGLRRGVPTAFASPGSDVLQCIGLSASTPATLATGQASELCPTTARTRRGRSARGFKAIATIGASIGARIPSTARATALRRDGGGRRGLQRWTRQGRFRGCRGTYRLVPARAAEFAKMDAWIVEMTLISRSYGEAAEVCKETT
jgi:hypothetical protein